MNKIKEIINLAKESYKINEVPVGAIIVLNDKIIAKDFNRREKENSVISHAEINCILKAAAKLGTWKLDNCEMYVTLRPCSMCQTVIKQSRISKVYFLLDKYEEKKEYYKTEFVKIDLCEDEKEYLTLIKSFFADKRK